MFYVPELLSLRRRGKLARCWLAATLSEQMFKKKVKQSTVQCIDITILCEEIISAVQTSSSTVCVRFSLYLSSQLLYGAVKLLLYQTKQLQENLFAINLRKSNIENSRRLRFHGPAIEISFHEDRDRNLIEDVPFLHEYMMQGQLSFGMLTDYEMEEFLLPQTEEQFLNEIRTFPRNQPEEIIEKCRKDTTVASYLRKIWTQPQEIIERSVAEVNLDNLNGETIEVGDVEGAQFKKPTTSKRRTTESLVETPAKRRKILQKSTEEVVRDLSVDVPSTSADVPSIVVAPKERRPMQESVDHPTEPSIAEPIVIPEFPNQQVHIDEIELVEQPQQRRRRRKFVDNEITLSDNQMRKMISDVRAHTTELWISSTRIHSADYYLKQPCSKISHGVLGNKLNKFFSKHMITRSVTENEFSEEEIVREGMTSKIHEKTGEMTSKIDLPTSDISEHSKTVEKIQPIQHTMQQTLIEMQVEDSEKQVEVSVPAVPEINGFEYTKVNPIESSERSLHVERFIANSVSPKATLRKLELKAFLEIRWRDEENIKFHELISPDSYTKIDVARAFSYCLEFQAEKYAVIKQDTSYGTIWIAKYVSSIESSEEAS